MPVAQGPLVTDWLSAIGQVAGAVGTFVAVAVALTIAIRDNRRLAAEIRDREAAPARLVTAVVRHDYGLTFLEIRNDSAEPIYNPEVSLTTTAEFSYQVTSRRVEERNGRFVEADSIPEGLRIIRAHEAWRLVVLGDNADMTAELDDFPEVTLRFADSAGLQWVRRGNGSPLREFS